VITRDVENGRYVIVDLRSKNGVRGNGKQYGKVQLRAGHHVDPSWVRFRFVAPQELSGFRATTRSRRCPQPRATKASNRL